MMDMIKHPEPIDRPPRQNRVSVDTATLIPILAAWMLQLPKLGHKAAIQPTLGLANLQKVVTVNTRSGTANIDLLDTENVRIQFVQRCEDLVRLVVALNVPLEAANWASLAVARRSRGAASCSTCC